MIFKNKSFNDWLYLVLVILTVFVGSVIAALIFITIMTILPNVEIDLPSSFWTLSVSCTSASILALFLNKSLLKPINVLGAAMKKVAQGDFKEQIEPNSPLRPIREIYSHYNIMISELDATETLQSDFISNVSHEFKTPINAIEGYATLLQDTAQVTQEQSEYVEKILLNTRRLSGLVGNILLLSKVENQSIPAGKASFRLDEQIRHAVLLLETQWIEKDLELDVELDTITYTASESLLLHVWLNLIGNAIKFNRHGGMIRLRLNKEEKNICFTIDDEGPGISEEAQKHIFDKFYQADGSHRQEGNGLGLALVKQIVTLCGGTVTMQNLPGRGSRFIIVFPC
ncbi:MAG: HAMP domain-containing histidine kinase [Clostridiales bacterium]|nr:HAMP domain-containing histidine kinase [Clostridiales bacterium]